MGTLQSMLDQRRIDFNATASEEKKKIYRENFEALMKSGILEAALNVGEKVPDFTLLNQLKEPIGLYDELDKGPIVLTWYRGGWCPYCNMTLHYLQEKLPDIQRQGASLMAITPELPDRSLSTVEKHNLQFHVLSDVCNKVSRNFGVVFKLTDAMAEIYQNSINLHGVNGDASNELPLAATYVIDSQGIICYAFLDVDYRYRVEPEEIIKKLINMNDQAVKKGPDMMPGP